MGAFKLSHPASRGSTTGDLLACVTAKDYIVSTKDAVFGLPHDETIAPVVRHGGLQPRIWFNYATAENERWLDAMTSRPCCRRGQAGAGADVAGG